MSVMKPSKVYRPGQPVFGNITFAEKDCLVPNITFVVKSVGNALQTAARGG